MERNGSLAPLTDVRKRKGVGFCCFLGGFTSRAVGINGSYSVEMRSVLREILIRKGAGFLIDSYHAIPGGREALYLGVLYFNPTYVRFKTEAAKKVGLNTCGARQICPVQDLHAAHSPHGFLVTWKRRDDLPESLVQAGQALECLL